MRVNLYSLIVVAVATGCKSDTEIGSVPNPYGVINPQDLDNPEIEDTILQLTPPVVDVLWIIDNSGSMADNQAALSTNFPSFMDYFLDSGLDYHIGVVSTDMDNPDMSGKLREAAGKRWIDNTTRNPEDSFTAMAMIGANGSATEKGRAAGYTALELLKDDYNAGFLRDRPDGGVHSIVISDEDDQSGNTPISKAEFIGYLTELRPDPDLVTFNSIVTLTPGVGKSVGRQYMDVTEAVGGIEHDIGDGDWVNVLEQLGIQAAGLNSEYFLSHLPVQSTLDVTVLLPNGVTTLTFQQGTDYTYSADRNSITFVEYVPDPLSSVNIKYTALASVVNGDGLTQ